MAAARSDKSSVETKGWILRSEVANRMRVSETTVKNWDGKLLHPKKEVRDLPKGGFREVWVYDPLEVADLASRRSRAISLVSDRGDIAARSFEMFQEGVPLTEVVIQLREPPERVDELHDQWMNMGGASFVINQAAHAALKRLVGAFDDVAGLVLAVERALAAARDGVGLVAGDAAAGSAVGAR